MKPNLIITAGGTGGHIFPALAIAKELSQDYQIIWVGGKNGMENQIVPKAGYPLETITISGIRNKGLWRKLSLPWILFRAIWQAIKLILCHQPQAIIGFGGYASFAMCGAAWLLRKKIIIHEQNSVAGLTNRILAKFATKVLVAFPNVLASAKTVMVGNPVRQEIADIYTQKLVKYQQKNDNKLRILIVGGSLGAKALNDLLPQALATIAPRISQVIHQVGRSCDVIALQKLYALATIQAQVLPFIDDMAFAYRNSDIIICRAGASTVAEIACANIASILIPFPYAVDDHQAVNAKYLAKHGAAILIRQEELDIAKLATLLQNLSLEDCAQMAKKAQELAIPDSTLQISQQIRQIIKKGR